MRLFDKRGKEVFARVLLPRPKDTARPMAWLSPYVGIFGNGPDLPWQFAEVCQSSKKEFVTNDGASKLVWVCQENLDGPRWGKPELALIPTH